MSLRVRLDRIKRRLSPGGLFFSPSWFAPLRLSFFCAA